MPDILPVSYFQKNHRRLAYRYLPPQAYALTIVFLNGFRSDMRGEKVDFLENICHKKGFGFLAFDYSGHGLSSGEFETSTFTHWLEDSLNMIKHVTSSPLILAGSSMGGWLAHLIALELRERIVGLIGIACAPDFIHELIWLKLPSSQQKELMTKGHIIMANDYNPNGWIITKGFIESGRNHLLLNKSISLDIPIRLLHGLQDKTVPAFYSQKLVEGVTSQDVILSLIKTGDHRLSRPEDLQILEQTFNELVARTSSPTVLF